MKLKKFAISAVFLFIAVFSAFVVSQKMSSPDFHQTTITSVDDNIGTVLKLTGASTAASAAVSMIPGDTATPIAEKLADFSTYFLVVLCVLYLEKYMTVIFGFVTFAICIPLACALMIGNQFSKTETNFWKEWAGKIVLVGFLIFAMVPASVKISNTINNVYRPSIEATIDSATDLSNDISSGVENEGQAEEKENKGIISSIVGNVTDGLSLTINAAEKLISRYIEALAVMLVTSCLIPILVFLFFFWLMKTVFGVRIPMAKEFVRSRIASKEITVE